ncbi:hypothetical protein B566_EDAN003019 [Ephemera danica]|nr:hypothetical protein B566_EDAN003019 [Ephemera danica]
MKKMFTNLASLLLGVASGADAETEAAAGGVSNEEEVAARLSVLEAEDDWLLVESEDLKAQQGALLSSMAVTPLTPISGRSRSHSTSSLPCMEDEYLTPPPCFTSTGPVVVETSPLENLLIEHPSMSVYQRPMHAAPAPLPPRSASLSPPPRARQPLAVVNPRPPRVPSVSLLKQQQQQLTAMQAGQKVQQKISSQVARRSALERSNKAREVGSARNKRARRSDHMQRHSGANNNRKC